MVVISSTLRTRLLRRTPSSPLFPLSTNDVTVDCQRLHVSCGPRERYCGAYISSQPSHIPWAKAAGVGCSASSIGAAIRSLKTGSVWVMVDQSQDGSTYDEHHEREQHPGCFGTILRASISVARLAPTIGVACRGLRLSRHYLDTYRNLHTGASGMPELPGTLLPRVLDPVQNKNSSQRSRELPISSGRTR